MNKFRLVLLTCGLLMLMFFVFREPLLDERPPLSSHAVVLAFGDSLTYGYGVAPQFSYPSILAKRTGLQVINAGISGELSSEGLKRLKPLLHEHRPELVILCHGGNDILRRDSDEELRTNLVQMIRISQNEGAQVLLVGVPDFHLLGFRTLELYEDIAEENKLMYEGSIISEVLADNALKSDRIHPNERGYALMAERFAQVLEDYGLIKNGDHR